MSARDPRDRVIEAAQAWREAKRLLAASFVPDQQKITDMDNAEDALDVSLDALDGNES